MRILLAVVLILTSSTAFAQAKKFRWGNETCLFESVYDAKKYTVAQLNDTRKLFTLDFFPNTIDPTPGDFKRIEALRVETLDAEYAARTNTLKRLNIVKTAYWETLRQKHLKELEQVYQLSRASILGYKNPSRLKDVKFAGACVTKYAEPLERGGGELLAAWQSVNEQTRVNNSDPNRIKSLFDEQSASPEKFRYAQMEVMSFGWWNCVNALIDRESDYERDEKEFRKLFSKTKTIECDEP
ncbi:MAG: hypothetical protein LH472_09015 [Pyrinomonadaceae bacterium]|nr:hypothetical protein [Pyrinomonadaceae bacterium]